MDDEAVNCVFFDFDDDELSSDECALIIVKYWDNLEKYFEMSELNAMAVVNSSMKLLVEYEFEPDPDAQLEYYQSFERSPVL